MSNQITFCPECRQDVKYSVREKIESANLKGKAYEFASHTAYCGKCGGEICIAKLEDANLKALYNAYRHKH